MRKLRCMHTLRIVYEGEPLSGREKGIFLSAMAVGMAIGIIITLILSFL